MQKLKMQQLLAALVAAIGLALTIYMVLVESEPGAIPLLLIVLGIGWYVSTRDRTRTSAE